MSRPRTARAAAKWTGTVAGVVLAVLWVGSGFWVIDRTRSTGSGSVQWTIGAGVLAYSTTRTDGPIQRLSVYWAPQAPAVWSLSYQVPRGSRFTLLPSIDGWPLGVADPWTYAVVVPLWFPCMLFALPTAYLWWADSRRARSGRCPNYRYDLAGLPAGMACPECGRTSAERDR